MRRGLELNWGRNIVSIGEVAVPIAEAVAVLLHRDVDLVPFIVGDKVPGAHSERVEAGIAPQDLPCSFFDKVLVHDGLPAGILGVVLHLYLLLGGNDAEDHAACVNGVERNARRLAD